MLENDAERRGIRWTQERLLPQICIRHEVLVLYNTYNAFVVLLRSIHSPHQDLGVVNIASQTGEAGLRLPHSAVALSECTVSQTREDAEVGCVEAVHTRTSGSA